MFLQLFDGKTLKFNINFAQIFVLVSLLFSLAAHLFPCLSDRFKIVQVKETCDVIELFV